MNILYLTSAMEDADYTDLLNEGYALNNPSNQNFHDKLIRALSLKNELVVFSFLSRSCQGADIKDNKPYHYLAPQSVFADLLGAKKRAAIHQSKLLLTEGVDIILFDALNRVAGNVAIALAKKRKVPAVAIVTDNPKNLSSTPYFYLSAFRKNVKNASAIITLSAGLLSTLGLTEKPHFIFSGIVEEPQSQKRLFPAGSYFYFGGALLPRYGVLNLLQAYEETKPDYDFVIAGHQSPSEEFLAFLRKDPRIHFLGQVSKEENYDLESHAALLVNPRPYTSKLDQESIPSKLLEYLATTTPILSTIHTGLQQEFPSDVHWLSDSSEAGIKSFFLAHMNAEKKLSGLQANLGKTKVLAHYGLEPIGQAIQTFLQAVKTSAN